LLSTGWFQERILA